MESWVRPNLEREVMMDMNEVVPGFLFLGSVRAAVDVQRLRVQGITHVLTVTDVLPQRVRQTYGLSHHLHINVDDLPGEKLSQHFAQAITFVEGAREGNGKVLVHCTAGVSRSATVVMAYLMHAHGLTLKQAFTLVKLRRTGVRPNGGFMLQLDAYEKELHGRSSITEHELHNITAVYRKEWRAEAAGALLPEPILRRPRTDEVATTSGDQATHDGSDAEAAAE